MFVDSAHIVDFHTMLLLNQTTDRIIHLYLVDGPLLVGDITTFLIHAPLWGRTVQECFFLETDYPVPCNCLAVSLPCTVL